MTTSSSSNLSCLTMTTDIALLTLSNKIVVYIDMYCTYIYILGSLLQVEIYCICKGVRTYT